MRAVLVMSALMVLMGCEGESASEPTEGSAQTPIASRRADDRESSSTGPSSRVFGIANDFSGKLNEEEEKAVPEPLRGAFYIESLRQVTTAELEKELKSKTLVAEENHDGNRCVALKDFRHVQFSDDVSGQMIVIERYWVIPN